MIEMHVFGLTIDTQSKTPIVVLRATDGNTLLPLWVGAMEAMAVSLVLNKETLPRPLTHDLMLSALKALKSELRRVEITDLKEGTYYAFLVINSPEGWLRIDCRPSDAIALAIRTGAPILVSEDVLQRYAETQKKIEQDTDTSTQKPDAATDMVRQAGAQREVENLEGKLLRDEQLPTDDTELRYQEMLRSIEPVSRRKM